MSTVHAVWMKQAESISIEKTIESMLKASDYWQPDRHTTWLSPERIFGLAKAQLINTLHSFNDGVYHCAEKKLSIAANARIDNRAELLNILNIEADHPSVETDSQLVLQCYNKWGRDCPAYLRGDFVFSIWDDAEQKLFCARDHFGVKVLFYSTTDQGLMLSNEHKAFFRTGWCDPTSVDEKWLVENLWNIGPLDFKSPNPAIQVLPPAHRLEVDVNGIRQSAYWRLAPRKDWQDFDDDSLIDELKARFEKAVTSRLDSQYPIGAELSEGLDSNGIVGYAAQHLNPNIIHTFSYRCEALSEVNRHIWEKTYRDIEDMLALHDNLKPCWQESDAEQTAQRERAGYHSFYHNFGVVVPVQGLFLRCQLAQKQGVRVLLSGWGGDHCVTCPGDEYANELFRRGRGIQLYRLLKHKYRRGRGRHPIRSMLTVALSELTPRLNLYLKLRRPGLEKAMQQRGRAHFLSEKWRRLFKLEQRLERFVRRYQRSTVQQHEQRELFEIDLTNRLTHSELVARQYRLEYRFPMLDLDLVEFAHSLPSRLKIHQGIERYPFRRLLEGVTTERIQWRRKADVSHPNIDFQATQKALNEEFLDKLDTNPLSQKYSSQEGLRHFVTMNNGGLNSLRFMVDFGEFHAREFERENRSNAQY